MGRFVYIFWFILTPCIPLSFEGEGEEFKGGGFAPSLSFTPPSLTREGGQGDRLLNDQSIKLLRKAINGTKLGLREKNGAMGRLP